MEGGVLWRPCMDRNTSRIRLYVNHVETVQFAPRTLRERRARLHNEDRMLSRAIERGGLARISTVQVSRQYQICTAMLHYIQCQSGASDRSMGLGPFRRNEWMVHNQNFKN